MSSSLLWTIGISVVGIYFIFMVINIVRRNNKKKMEFQGRLDSLAGKIQKVEKRTTARETFFKEASSSKQKSKLSSKIVKVTSLKHWLHYTGYNISPAALYSVGFLLAISFTIGLHMFTQGNLILISMSSILLSALLCFAVIQFLIGREKNRFLNGFPDALDLIRRALRAGYAADRAIVMAAEESPEPVKSAFKSVLNRLSIGEPLEDALEDVANDVGIDEFHMLAIVLVLQRDTGGSLADVVENFGSIMRERIRLRKKVKAITAEGKASGYMVSAIPFFIVLILMFVAPNYLEPLFTTEKGQNFLMVGGGLMFTGIAIIYRMINKDYY